MRSPGRAAHSRPDARTGDRAQRALRLRRFQPARSRALRAVVREREQPANSARFTFLDPAAVDFYPEWEQVASDLVAHLRSEAGRNAYDDRGLSDLVGDLSIRSNEFRTRWAAHNVRFHRTGTKRLHHPSVGDLKLSYESMEISADNGLTLTVYTAEAESASQQALDLLASWTATLAEEQQARAADAANPGS